MPGVMTLPKKSVNTRNLVNGEFILHFGRGADNRSAGWPSSRTEHSLSEELQLSYGVPAAKDDSPSLPGKNQISTPHYAKYLEGKITTMQEQHDKVLMEKGNLSNQITALLVKNDELEKNNAALEQCLDQMMAKRELKESANQVQSSSMSSRETNTPQPAVQTKRRHEEAATLTENPKRWDCGVQTLPEEPQPCGPACLAMQASELVPISKSELESLEADMRVLLEAVRSKEELWEQATNREQHYREHLARLSVELITARQLADSRHSELQSFLMKLTENKEELRVTQKELALAKRSLMKLQKRSSAPDTNIPELAAMLKREDSSNSKEKQRLMLGESKQQQLDSRPSTPLVTKQKSKVMKSVRIA